MQQSFDKAREMSAKIVNVLISSDIHREPESGIERLYRESLRLSRFELPSSRTVGLVGDSGVGKSSLINSLLDKENLARSNNNGSACTCVATEYHYHDRDDYAVEGEIFSMEELKKQYGEMLRTYQESKSPPEDLRGEELADLQRRAKIARDTFGASFRERLEQRPDLLALPINQAVQTMLQWASQLLPQHSAGQTTRVYETYSDIANCSSRIRELTSEVQTLETQGPKIPWPFVRKLRYVWPSGKTRYNNVRDYDLVLWL
ncbi:uncharacterized protein N0V89_005719 [Didymosphaeria variabile]|uniref:G domain-containing protein n=1 Tax=Didymosphaeria variabile TaxID=1932322 RepID=A0A9W8XP20_9PLEO|nr:uncharacterized protein N0V89_005719 [Didymosphaeria variabile]KAJ4353987.1 hypothetical protein N0V89_005719 [Didymosphaeria variabile]